MEYCNTKQIRLRGGGGCFGLMVVLINEISGLINNGKKFKSHLKYHKVGLKS